MAPESTKDSRLWGLAYSAGSSLVGPVLLGLLVDYFLGTLPWALLGGVALGMGLLAVVLYRFTVALGQTK